MQNKHKKIIRLWKKTNGKCAHCGKVVYDVNQRTVDHYVPKSYNGTIDERNLFPVCKTCNQARGNKIVGIDFYPYAPYWMQLDAQDYEREFSSKYRTMADAEYA